MLAPERVRQLGRSTILGDITGGLADLGVMVPLAAALILINGLDAGAIFLGAGALVLGAGAAFRIPFPVQPLKALTAVAVAQSLAPGVIHAAGLEIAAFLLVLSIGDVAGTIARVFTKPVVRALQLGVGILLVITAIRLAADPPPIFLGAPALPWRLILAMLAFVAVWFSARRKNYGLALLMLVVGIAATWTSGTADVGAPSFHFPIGSLPSLGDFGTAFFLLVIPQLPLTFGNAVVAVNDVAKTYFGDQAAAVSPARVCVSCGVGNLFSAAIGGMPMCHGAGGLTAHVRLGARSAHMNLVLGGAFVVLGLFFAAEIPAVLGLLPVWVLAAFLGYAGVRHAWLVSDLRRTDLAVAAIAGAVGAWRSNLALTAALALVGAHIAARLQRR